jgi:hypothetical protein
MGRFLDFLEVVDGVPKSALRARNAQQLRMRQQR